MNQPRGITVLGTPIGCVEYVSEKMTRRIETERQLWDMIPCVLDHQCAWQLLVQSANPRANHSLRIIARIVGSGRDFPDIQGMADRDTKEVASLPIMGGLGLRSAQRCAEVAQGLMGRCSTHDQRPKSRRCKSGGRCHGPGSARGRVFGGASCRDCAS